MATINIYSHVDVNYSIGTKYHLLQFNQLQKSIILSKLETALISPHRYHITTVHHARYLFIL